MGSVMGLDYSEHNKMVARKRGKDWIEKLRAKQALKVKMNANSTVLAHLRVSFDPHLTQEDMVRRVGNVTQPMYARIERGERLAKKEIAVRIAKVFKKELKDIFVEPHPNKFLAI